MYIGEAIKELEMLCEDIESFKELMRGRFPKANLTDEVIDTLIALDPTYREGSGSKGKYADWIVRLFAKGGLKAEDFYKVTNLLREFESKKASLDNKDINQYKGLPDLFATLQRVDRTHRQQVRDNQKARKGVDLNSEAEKVYDGSSWEVWIPKTYAASCKLGAGTNWCTASTERDYYYKQYSEEGPLYIVINKNDPEEKYQFHFESQQFMDKYDDDIDLWYFFKDNPSLLDYFKKVFAEKLSLPADFDYTGASSFITTDPDIFDNERRYLENPMEYIKDIYEAVYDNFSFYYESPYAAEMYSYFADNKEILSQLKSIGVISLVPMTREDSTKARAEFEAYDGDLWEEVVDAFRVAWESGEEAGVINEIKKTISQDVESYYIFAKEGLEAEVVWGEGVKFTVSNLMLVLYLIYDTDNSFTLAPFESYASDFLEFIRADEIKVRTRDDYSNFDFEVFDTVFSEKLEDIIKYDTD